MNRRQFIKMLGVGVAAFVAMPSMVFGRSKLGNFKPDLYYGDWVQVKSQDGYEKATDFINKHMKSIVPPEYRKQVKIIMKKLGSSGTEDPLRQRGSVGFKYVPEKPWIDSLKIGKRRSHTNKSGFSTSTDYPEWVIEKMDMNPWFGWGYDPKELRVFGQ